MARSLPRLLVPALALASLIPSLCRAAVVSVSGRRLLVNGAPFVMKGVNYTPTPAGRNLTNYNAPADAPMYTNDFRLLKAMGVNTLRLPQGDQATTAFLDAARDNGFYVVMGYYVNESWDVTDTSTKAAITTAVLDMVNAFKSHPAVLMWAVGNEVTFNNAFAKANPAAWYSFLNTLSGDIKAADPNHPVTTAVVDVIDIGVSTSGTLGSNPSNLDLWGVNVYRGASFGNAFTFLASTTTKPVWLSEFGADAYDGTSAHAEDQATQASLLSSQWTEIKQNLSADGSGAVVGGCVFEWSDEWWKGSDGTCSGANLGTNGPQGILAQDTACDWFNGAYPDPDMNEEWWGIVAISSSVPVQKRVRQAYYTLKDLWNPSMAAVGSVFSAPVSNAPNPVASGSTTRILFSLAQAPDSVKVDVFDAEYRKVVSLPWSGAAGSYEADWDGRDDDGRPVSPGVYVARVSVRTKDQSDVKYRKIAVVR